MPNVHHAIDTNSPFKIQTYFYTYVYLSKVFERDLMNLQLHSFQLHFSNSLGIFGIFRKVVSKTNPYEVDVIPIFLTEFLSDF